MDAHTPTYTYTMACCLLLLLLPVSQKLQHMRKRSDFLLLTLTCFLLWVGLLERVNEAVKIIPSAYSDANGQLQARLISQPTTIGWAKPEMQNRIRRKVAKMDGKINQNNVSRWLSPISRARREGLDTARERKRHDFHQRNPRMT